MSIQNFVGFSLRHRFGASRNCFNSSGILLLRETRLAALLLAAAARSFSCRDHNDSDVEEFCVSGIVSVLRLGESCPRRLCSARISSESSVIAFETASAELK